MIVNRLCYFRDRTGPQIHEKYENIIKYRKSNEKKQKLYDYYKCDYCSKEIIIKDKKHEMSGGTVVIPKTLTKCGNITLALCNKCLNKTLKEFEDRN